ncbi:MAG: SMC-Scp complex subunit ScpB [Acidobacteriota bacterium]
MNSTASEETPLAEAPEATPEGDVQALNGASAAGLAAPDNTTAAAAEPPAVEKPRETRAGKIRDAAEAVLFSSPRPVSERDLANVLEATVEAVREALASLAAETDSPSRGVRLEHVGGGWRFVTRPEFDSLLRRFHEVSERSRLSLAALETLAIIAYRQPITLPEVQDIRGVNSASVLKTLFEKKLITTAGKKAVVGTPFLYKTTPDFLVRFGLNELEELPRPEEIEEDLAATVSDEPLPSAATSGAAALASVPPSANDDEDDFDDEDDDHDDDASIAAAGPASGAAALRKRKGSAGPPNDDASDSDSDAIDEDDENEDDEDEDDEDEDDDDED